MFVMRAVAKGHLLRALAAAYQQNLRLLRSMAIGLAVVRPSLLIAVGCRCGFATLAYLDRLVALDIYHPRLLAAVH